MRFVVAAAVLLAGACSVLSGAGQDLIDEAVTAFQNGELAKAEQLLRSDLRSRPHDLPAIEVLAVLLDREKRYSESDPLYRTALASDPRSPSLLNNYGNHMVAAGKEQQAQSLFLRVIAVDPHHPNANLQLARIAISEKKPSDALARLDELPPNLQRQTDVMTMRMQADYLAGKTAEADALLGKLVDAGEARDLSLGAALSQVRQYSKAETIFARVVDAQPDNFEARYDLGLAASHAGHNQAARDALKSALDLQPTNVNVLCDLAAVDLALKQQESALELLAKAHHLAPERPDVEVLLARTFFSLGYFSDAIQTWDSYLKLRPGDQVAKRDRAFAQTAAGQNTASAMTELNEYARAHPHDPIGHYQLAVAEASGSPAEAQEELDTAIRLDPAFAPARFARGLLLYRDGQLEQALADFDHALRADPENAIYLDRVAQTYVALNRTADALPLFQKAAGLAPANGTILLHLGRALVQSGNEKSASKVFGRYRELGSDKHSAPKRAGLAEFLTLTPEEQFARYRAGLERTLQNEPNNTEAQVRYLSYLIQGGEWDRVKTLTRDLERRKIDAGLLHQAASALLNARRYELGRELLNALLPTVDSTPELLLDSAIAAFHTSGPSQGLQKLDRIPQRARDEDFQLASAEMLFAAGETRQAETALASKAAFNPIHLDLYEDAAVALIREGCAADAVRLLRSFEEHTSGVPRIELTLAVALALQRSNGASELLHMEQRWPEWEAPLIAHALILQSNTQYEAASRKLELALELSSSSPAAYYARAMIELSQSPPQDARAKIDIGEAESLAPGDPVLGAVSAALGANEHPVKTPAELVADGLHLLLR